MSQIIGKSHLGFDVLFGLDEMCGWFITIFNSKGDEAVLELDTLFHGLSQGDLLQQLTLALPEEEQQRLHLELECIAMNLDPEFAAWQRAACYN